MAAKTNRKPHGHHRKVSKKITAAGVRRRSHRKSTAGHKTGNTTAPQRKAAPRRKTPKVRVPRSAARRAAAWTTALLLSGSKPPRVQISASARKKKHHIRAGGEIRRGRDPHIPGHPIRPSSRHW